MVKSLVRSRRADAAIFLMALIALVIIGLIYIGVREATEISLHMMNETSMGFNGGDFEDRVWQLKDFINWYPILATFIILLWAIVWTKNKKSGVYGG